MSCVELCANCAGQKKQREDLRIDPTDELIRRIALLSSLGTSTALAALCGCLLAVRLDKTGFYADFDGGELSPCVSNYTENFMQTYALVNYRLFGVGCTVALLAMITACTQLIRPNYTTQLGELRSGQYSLDVEHAYVHFKIDHLGLSTVVGRFNSVQGSLDFNPDNIEGLVLEGQIDASSVDMNNVELEATLMGRDWFDVGVHSDIRFNSQQAQLNEQGMVVIDGTLTLRGVSQNIVLEARFNGGADNVLTGKYTLGFSANTSISRSAFGMNAISALVGDEVRVELYGEFQKN